MAKYDLSPWGIQYKYGGKNLKGDLPRAALNSKWTTALKTIRQQNYNRDMYKWGFSDAKPTISSAYNKVISRQYPKYTGPKPPNVGIGHGPVKGLWGTITKGTMVQSGGKMMRAVGEFSNIPPGYLINLANQKHLAARTARVAKGVSAAKAANPIFASIEGAIAIHKGYKRATSEGGKEFHTHKFDNKYGTKGY